MATLSQTIYIPPVRNNRDTMGTIIDDTPQDSDNPFTFGDDVSFDDLYDISEGEEEVLDIPMMLARSPLLTRSDSSETNKPLPIPDFSSWPAVPRKQRGDGPQHITLDRALLSPPIATPESQLTRIAKRSSVYSAYSNDAPSLDDSFTSEDMSSMSCPSTPDISAVQIEEHWSAPVQLNPASLMTLGSLATQNSPAMLPAEMQELPLPTAAPKPVVAAPRLNTNVDSSLSPFDSGELSALSIPSPGGFFATLEPNSRMTWLPTPHREDVGSAVAEQFYARPFDFYQPSTVEIVVEDTSETDGPPTARQVPPPPTWALPPTPRTIQDLKSPSYFTELREFRENYENEHYKDQIQQQIDANIDRTASWLQTQDGSDEEADATIPSPETSYSGPGTPIEEAGQDTTFYQGFSHLQQSKRDSDAFVHRKARTEKLRLDRKCLFSSHVNQLEGKYTLESPASQVPQTITTIRVVDGRPQTFIEDDSEKIVIANAQREQSCLEQIAPVTWAVEATKFLNGGSLLTSPVTKHFLSKGAGRVLDLGGAASCDWAWQVALEFPLVSVHNVCTADGPRFDKTRATPQNFKRDVVKNLWTLEYPDNYFDCISARNLYALLRNQKNPRYRGQDEYDLCLQECLRVLKPGGFLEFALLDAEILNAGRKGQALSAEFCSNLRGRGYDIAPTKSWLPRLRKAGFGHTRRAWLVLPMSQFSSKTEGGSTAEASHITGMVGSWAWERWMVKLQREMGRDESALLDGVVAALEEGSKTGGSWRYLSGWAQKPFSF